MNNEFNHVSLLLQEPLSDEPEALIKDLEAIEVWNSRMQFLLAEANSHLSHQTLVNLPTDGTDLIKKVALKAMTAGEEETRDKIEGICEAIKTRITLGQSILKFYSSTQNMQYNDQTKSLRKILGD